MITDLDQLPPARMPSQDYLGRQQGWYSEPFPTNDTNVNIIQVLQEEDGGITRSGDAVRGQSFVIVLGRDNTAINLSIGSAPRQLRRALNPTCSYLTSVLT